MILRPILALDIGGGVLWRSWNAKKMNEMTTAMPPMKLPSAARSASVMKKAPVEVPHRGTPAYCREAAGSRRAMEGRTSTLSRNGYNKIEAEPSCAGIVGQGR